jgi:hypothetical protein
VQPRHDWLPGPAIEPGPRDAKGAPEPGSRDTDFLGVSLEPSWRGATRERACS